MRNSALSIEEQSPEDYTEENPEYNDEYEHWIIVHTTRDVNGDAAIDVFLSDELSVDRYKSFKESEYRTVEHLTDAELAARLKGER